MAKTMYKIPVRLDRSFLDHVITLPIFGMKVAVRLKQVMFYIGGFVFVIWAAMNTFISQANGWLIAGWVAWGFVIVAYLGSVTKTGELRLRGLPALVGFLPLSARRVMTRMGSDPSDFYSIIRVDNVTADGEITFANGWTGRVYLVVGSASHLLFDQDQERIFDRVDTFWRKMLPGVEVLTVTTKEPQRTHHQIAYLEQRNRRLEVRDPDLLELQAEQYDLLRYEVGGARRPNGQRSTNRFTSLHQYQLVMARKPDLLHQGELIIRSEVENGNSLVYKEATRLSQEEVYDFFRIFTQDGSR